MMSVDNRLEDLRSQINGVSSAPPGFSCAQPRLPLSLEVNHGTAEISPILWTMKMEVPKFDGTDPNGWAFQVEEFFDFHGTSDAMRLKIASFHMEGRAAAWYQWMKANNLLTTWPKFLLNLKHRFSSSFYEDHQENLSKLTNHYSGRFSIGLRGINEQSYGDFRAAVN